ncbi:hypothetical protein Tco_1461128, partial [Tanacetum coccineum]
DSNKREEGIQIKDLKKLDHEYAIEQARDVPSEIKRLNNFLVEFLEDQMIRKKPTELENVYKDTSVGTSQVDMMPQISVRDPVVLTKIKGRPREATRVKHPLEVKQKKTVTCSFCREKVDRA